MNLSSFYKLFPIPKYLEFSLVGFDISDERIKYAELVRRGSKYNLGHYGRLDFPAGSIVSGKIVNRENVLAALKKIKKENGFTFVQVALPEEETFVSHMTIPYMDKSELRGSIELQLEEYIPLPADQVIFDYEIYNQKDVPRGDYLLGVFTAPKSLVNDYTNIIKEAGMMPSGMEIEVQSIARALVLPDDPSNYLVVDFGKTRVSLAVVSRGIPIFTTTIKSISGEILTHTVQKALSVTTDEAEELKSKNGLDRSPQNKKVFEALLPIIASLKDEIGRYCGYWNNLQQNFEIEGKISKILFCGGQSELPGLVEYIGSGLNLPAEIGNPWGSFMDIKKDLPPLDFNESMRFTTAIGLALRGVRKNIL